MKPKICEILGVEVGEVFNISGYEPNLSTPVKFWIMDDGTFSSKPNNAYGASYALLRAIENPEYVIRKPRWTEEELRDMETLARLSMDTYIIRGRASAALSVHFTSGGYIYARESAFPSVRPGESIIICDELRKAGRIP